MTRVLVLGGKRHLFRDCDTLMRAEVKTHERPTEAYAPTEVGACNCFGCIMRRATAGREVKA